jgi:ribosomal protein S18 acetylase RimI-like enzyme
MSETLLQMTPQIRVMTPADLAAGMRLKDAAGWNQTEEDWRRFLRANPEGCFVADWKGQVTGTATTIIYEDRFAWIGMVLVDPEFRGRGIGSALLGHTLDYLHARKVPCTKLDATPQGKGLYQRLGFRSEYEIERHILKRGAGAARLPAREEDVRIVLGMDRDVFGADRSAVLSSVASAAPEFVITARQGRTLSGYALGRRGSRADHLGPWVACNRAAAREILERFLDRSGRNFVLVDVVKDNAWAPALLAEKGFKFSRNLTRMWRGKNAHPGRPDLLGAILGPEFG